MVNRLHQRRKPQYYDVGGRVSRDPASDLAHLNINIEICESNLGLEEIDAVDQVIDRLNLQSRLGEPGIVPQSDQAQPEQQHRRQSSNSFINQHFAGSAHTSFETIGIAYKPAIVSLNPSVEQFESIATEMVDFQVTNESKEQNHSN